ncbi:MAG TPA: hypothetical protein DDY77_04380, partial [Clostridiales bacterium]|nr:hypothetical protein [Clostridiales bacterium]
AWKNGETVVNGVMAKVADCTVNELTDFNNIVDSWTITDVLGEEAVSNNNILKIVGNTPIGELASGIDNILVGEIMGYTYTTDSNGNRVWKDGNGKEVTGVALAVADFKIGEITGEKLQDKVDELTVDQIIKIDENDESNPMKLLKGVKVKEATSVMKTKLEEATVGQMGDYGVIDLEAAVEKNADGTTKVTVAQALTEIIGNENWKGKTTSALLTELVSKAYEMKKLTTGGNIGG